MNSRQKAAFMREVGATTATWDEHGRLVHLVLGSHPQPGPAARMKDFHERTTRKSPEEQRHDILFGATSVRPRFIPLTPPNAVPRAERAKRDAQRGNSQEGNG